MSARTPPRTSRPEVDYLSGAFFARRFFLERNAELKIMFDAERKAERIVPWIVSFHCVGKVADVIANT